LSKSLRNNLVPNTLREIPEFMENASLARLSQWVKRSASKKV
jgi:hypothetical protein